MEKVKHFIDVYYLISIFLGLVCLVYGSIVVHKRVSRLGLFPGIENLLTVLFLGGSFSIVSGFFVRPFFLYVLDFGEIIGYAICFLVNLIAIGIGFFKKMEETLDEDEERYDKQFL